MRIIFEKMSYHGCIIQLIIILSLLTVKYYREMQ